MIYWIWLLIGISGVLFAINAVREERSRRSKAERELRRFEIQHPPKKDQGSTQERV